MAVVYGGGSEGEDKGDEGTIWPTDPLLVVMAHGGGMHIVLNGAIGLFSKSVLLSIMALVTVTPEDIIGGCRLRR